MIYAVIPARSGSKGFPGKNIRKLHGIELMGYSIAFAKSLPVDRVFCSTDSAEYSTIARSYGAEVPFLRSCSAANDTAMEQDILVDLIEKWRKFDIAPPEIIVWLRPTFIFRDRDTVETAVKTLLDDPAMTACRVVVRAESRLYKNDNGSLVPTFDDHGKSMIRRQDVGTRYRVYSTDVFRLPRIIDEDFLGRKVGFVEAPAICGLDVDDEFDFELKKCVLSMNSTYALRYIDPALHSRILANINR